MDAAFEFEGARAKRTEDEREDAPAQETMRGDRRVTTNPTTDQKKVLRRAQQQHKQSAHQNFDQTHCSKCSSRNTARIFGDGDVRSKCCQAPVVAHCWPGICEQGHWAAEEAHSTGWEHPRTAQFEDPTDRAIYDWFLAGTEHDAARGEFETISAIARRAREVLDQEGTE